MAVRPGFQVYVDARGDLYCAEGSVIDRAHNTVFPVGDTGLADTGLAGGLAEHLAAVEEIPAGQDSILLGGSGRNVIMTDLAPLAGIWQPGRPGEWALDIFTLTVAGASSATISDGTDIVAELTTGGAAPAGSYVATSYGEDTYNSSAAFTLTGATDIGWPGGLVDVDVSISAGTALGGSFTAADAVNFTSASDSDWTIIVHSDGTADLIYDGTIIATRASGLSTEACGIYNATAAGKILNPEAPGADTSPPSDTNPFGVLTLEFNWAGAPDLDIGVSFLDQTAGFGHSSPSTGGPVGDFMVWSGDNTTTGGPETVTIDLAAAWDAGEISTFADVLAEADWYTGAGGSGPASLTVTYSLGGGPVVHTIHPAQGTPAATDALSLRILADGTVTPTGEDWNATVRAVRRVPVAGVVFIIIAEAAGEITAVTGPFLATTLPADTAGVVHYPLATSDGSGGVRQSHSGPLVWECDPLPPLTKTARDALASPATGMMIYQTTDTPGLRVYNGTDWIRFTETAD